MYETAQNLSGENELPEPLQEVDLEIADELVPFDEDTTVVSEPAADTDTYRNPGMDRTPEMAKPTSEWEENFGHKVKQALEFADTHPLDRTAEQKIKKLLVEYGYFPARGQAQELDRKDIATALLLAQKGLKRLMTSDRTAATAQSIIDAKAAEADDDNL